MLHYQYSKQVGENDYSALLGTCEEVCGALSPVLPPKYKRHDLQTGQRRASSMVRGLQYMRKG